MHKCELTLNKARNYDKLFKQVFQLWLSKSFSLIDVSLLVEFHSSLSS